MSDEGHVSGEREVEPVPGLVPRAEEFDASYRTGAAPWDIGRPQGAFVRLLDAPEEIPILAPLIEREILYRLIVDGPGARLGQIALTGSHTHRITKAISWLRENYDQPLRIETIARTVNMSPSSLHHHFKAVTAMSPLQYQKQLRLQEARRLMITEVLDAATASHRVGYESASQFSREYRRLFGAPPVRDIARLRDTE